MVKLLDRFLEKVYPLLRWISTLHFPYTRKKITGVHYYLWRDDIKPGDVFLTSTRGEISNLINPSEYKHGAIYYGKDEQGICWVYEATKKGVGHVDLVTFLTTKDRLLLLRNKNKLNENIFRRFLLTAEGLPYDDQFSTSSKKYYCFELIARALEFSVYNYKAKYKVILGKKFYTSETFTPDDFETIIAH